MLDLTTFVTLVVIVGIASYVQTLTGFAFALVFMSAVAMTGVIGIEDGAVIVSLLMLANAALILMPERNYIATRPLLQILPLALVGTVTGTLLLPVFIATSVVWLKFNLSVAVILSSLRLLRMPKISDTGPTNLTYPLSGLAGGLMGGLFAVPGPPIVYALQRYIPGQREIRATLVAVFAVITAVRLVFSTFLEIPTFAILATTSLLLPVVVVFTTLARRWPPPFSPRTAKFVTVLLLVLTGLVLIAPAAATAF